MQLDVYILLTFVSAVALTLLEIQLWNIRIPRREDTHKLRTACAILTGSYFILAVPAAGGRHR